MSGFNVSELLPFYLDETDEHIAALNDALLRLEQDSTDAQALAEAFRMFHSIKGASVVMGFESVNRLTHNLESLFDQFRGKKRTLDRPVLDLTFRCLDELRDYRERETWGGTFRRPHRYGALTATEIVPPFVRVDASGRRYDPTRR